MVSLNIYDLSRNFWDWAFENPEKIKPPHAAIYFFAIEHCNRLGWKEKFGFPSQMTMDAIGISKYQTYIKYLNELIGYGFITMIQKSKNQYSSNIISLSNASTKKGKALDKALIKHRAKQPQKQLESNDKSNYDSDGSIDIQYTNKQYTNKQINNGDADASDFKVCTDLWFGFVEKQTGSKPKFNGVQGKALKSIIEYLDNIKKDGSTPAGNFEAILNHWDRLDEWQKTNCLDLTTLDKKISVVIETIKNGKGKQRLSTEQLNALRDPSI